jgi:hypothetical protein
LCYEIKKFEKYSGLKHTIIENEIYEWESPIDFNLYEICCDNDAIGSKAKRKGFCSKVINDFFYYYNNKLLEDVFKDAYEEDDENYLNPDEQNEIIIKGKVDKFIQECDIKMIDQNEASQKWKQDVLRNRDIEWLLATREIWKLPVENINEIITHL